MKFDLKIKSDFPIFEAHPSLVYLDNAATVMKPRVVIEAETEFYKTSYAAVHRSTYDLADQAAESYEKARRKMADFIGAGAGEIIFTKNATEALNLAAHIEGQRLKRGDEIIVSIANHHSNILPWQRVAQEKGAEIVWLELEDDLAEKVSNRAKVIALTHVGNVLGEVLDVERVVEVVRQYGGSARLILDCAQSGGRMPINVRQLGVDYAAFSGHKMYGPTGTGWLYAKEEYLEQAEPLLAGGGTIKKVERDATEWAEAPLKFEAGTPDAAGVIGLGAAIDYMQSMGMDKVWEHDRELARYAYDRLSEIKNLKIYGRGEAGVLSFQLGSIHSHDVAEMANAQGAAVRAGHQCAQLLMEALGVQEVTRASFGIYNTAEDVDKLIEVLAEAQKKFFDYGYISRRTARALS